jgi:hypothetical protein
LSGLYVVIIVAPPEVHKKKRKNLSRYKPDYWLVDHIFIKEFFADISGDNFEKFKLEVFMPYA